MNTIQTYDFPGKQISMEYVLPTTMQSLEEVTNIGLDAIETVTKNNFEFFCADITLGLFDHELWYPVEDLPEEFATWMLKTSHTPEQVVCKPFYTKQQLKEVDCLSTAEVFDAIHYITQKTPNASSEHAQVFWQDISFRSLRTLLPDWNPNLPLMLQTGNKVFEYPTKTTNKGTFVNAPMDSYILQSPASLVLENDGGNSLTLTIYLLWSCWTEKQMPGAKLIEERVNQLKNNGWQLKLSTVPFIGSST
ncbi:hypothetical protein [Microscilla marina]|uniref:Uncharacterized protein n=1 Tax=Microscilla marina ATCC 23134 TaxID=313606 RepID=A1ZL51_MICM2|nr:hypothetical protein [Microscilla marina]EAY29017.1 hypothetical protein M23134_00171 [Microscilla marina ATCC 23134]